MQAAIGAGRRMTIVRMQFSRIASCLVGAIVAVALCAPPARSQTLAPAAQDAMEHGLAAAQQQDYKLAYRYFLDAQKADPGAASIRFNLGLAAAKIPGHEFRAIAWFKAYLLANPDAQNAGPVRAQITNLEVVFEARLGKVVDALEPVTKAIADADYIDPAGSGADGRYESRLTNGGLLAAMRFYLGDITGGQKTRQHFGIGKGHVHNHISSKIYGHLDRGLASAGLYDELISGDWLSGDNALANQAQAPDGALFAIERGDFDAADHMYQRGSSRAIRRSIVCKFVELGRLDDARKSADGLFSKEDEKDFGANREKWFDANCSGWWLKKGGLDRLVARGRDGQAIAVWTGDYQVQGLVARFDEISMDKYLIDLKKYVAIKAKIHPSGPDVEGALESLADLFESYRQMHGPYGR
jgi:Zn-finger nucleic acid-binding protein